QLYIATGGDGVLRVYHGTTLAPATMVKFDSDADNVRYDRAARRIYVGHGSGALGAVDTATNQVVADIALSGHPESFQLENAGPRIFVNVPGAHQVAMVDREKRSTVAKWSLGLTAANYPMTLDEENHRLFVGCRMPARLIVFDTETGKQIAKLELHGDCDDLFFDAVRRQIYATCGEGFIDVFAQADADHYALKEAIPTVAKARTGFFDGDRLYLAVPKRGDDEAEIRCYRVAK
ncbi:MAG TPA: hypothetical protein VFJ90_01860, partial [Candidatus Didemnitutus sp.]|nr:hypothetical protein [Candidatus Didemnitutus sp.]